MAIRRFCLSAALLLCLPIAHAQLYKKAAPPNSTFVRICNGTALAGLASRVGDHVEPQLPPFTVSDYLFLAPGPQSIQINGLEQTYNLEANHYYTVAYDGSTAKLLELKDFESQLKAMIVVINLVPGTTLSLKTVDAKTTVFDGVASGSAVQREVNPVRVNLAIFDGDRKLADAPPMAFERGRIATLVVGGSASAPAANWQTQE